MQEQTMIKRVLMLLVLLAVAAPTPATPSTYKWQRETLLGANPTSYFTLREVHTCPGSYYEFSESLALCTYETSTGKRLEERIIRRSEHKQDPNTNEWQSTSTEVGSLNLGELSAGKKMLNAYPRPVTFSQRKELVPTADGIVEKSARTKQVVVPLGILQEAAPWYAEAFRNDSGPRPRIVERFMIPQEKNSGFLLIRTGEMGEDISAREAVVPLTLEP